VDIKGHMKRGWIGDEHKTQDHHQEERDYWSAQHQLSSKLFALVSGKGLDDTEEDYGNR